MTRRRRAFIAGSIVAVLAGGISIGRAATPLAGPFHTSGNQILDANQQPVRLRGVTAGILDDNPYINTLNDVTEQSFDAAKSWGVNAVRVPLSEQYWFQSWGCRYRITPADYQNNVATVVQRITSRGMLAILDLNMVAKQNTGWCGASGQQPMADYPRAVTLWSQAATRFRNNPLVAFDLFNEPHIYSWGIWRYGGGVLDASGYWKAAGMQQMYDAIRGTGAGNLVFVSGNNWAAAPPPSAYLLHGYNIVYAAHAYTNVQPTQILDQWTPLSLSQPVAVTEFGWPNNSQGTYNASVIAWAETHNVSWLAFIWNAGPQFALVTDLHTFQPTPSGIPVKNGLALNH